MSVSPCDLVRSTEFGLYCPPGDFFIDPWQPVDRALLTHAHADHARSGCGQYLTSRAGETVARSRLGEDARIESLDWDERLNINGTRVSLHPSGHILGSAQVRIEYQGDVWCVSGDYKLYHDPTCRRFEPVSCRVFVTESTFGLPIFRWPSAEEVIDQINSWWRANADGGRTSVIYCYSLGKAQRLLASLDASIGPFFCHGAIARLNAAYQATGIELPECRLATEVSQPNEFTRGLILAPPSAQGTPWMRRFGDCATAIVSGWMAIRGHRRRRNVDHGFVLSDHADWDGLNAAVRNSGAERVLVTHGSTAPFTRWLSGQGIEAAELPAQFDTEAVQ